MKLVHLLAMGAVALSLVFAPMTASAAPSHKAHSAQQAKAHGKKHAKHHAKHHAKKHHKAHKKA